MKVLTINRSEWRRGGSFSTGAVKGQGITRLLNDQGFKCCLGFDALACGVTKGEIFNAMDPESLTPALLPEDYIRTRLKAKSYSNLAPVPGMAYYENSEAVKAAINANDDDTIDEAERERLVKNALLRLGWDDVVFV